jgi:hypothetical protein
MDETAAPDETVASDEQAEPEAKPRGERRRFRVPTSVIVTVLIALFSVWVAPAFTRQWDDRRKVGEMKAALAEEIATTTARTVAAGMEISRSVRPEPRLDSWEAADARWRLDYFRMKMKLTAYFDPAISEDWNQFSADLRNFLFLCDLVPPGGGARGYLASSEPPGQAERIDQVSLLLENISGRVRDVTNEPMFLVSTPEDARQVAEVLVLNASARDVQLDNISNELFAIAERQTAAVLAAHVKGFSTTRGDLLHDLLP